MLRANEVVTGTLSLSTKKLDHQPRGGRGCAYAAVRSVKDVLKGNVTDCSVQHRHGEWTNVSCELTAGSSSTSTGSSVSVLSLRGGGRTGVRSDVGVRSGQTVLFTDIGFGVVTGFDLVRLSFSGTCHYCSLGFWMTGE